MNVRMTMSSQANAHFAQSEIDGIKVYTCLLNGAYATYFTIIMVAMIMSLIASI